MNDFRAQLATKFDQVERAAIKADLLIGSIAVKQGRPHWEQTCGQIADADPAAARAEVNNLAHVISELTANSGADAGQGNSDFVPTVAITRVMEDFQGKGVTAFNNFVNGLGIALDNQLRFANAFKLVMEAHADTLAAAQEHLLNIADSAIEALDAHADARRSTEKGVLEQLVGAGGNAFLGAATGSAFGPIGTGLGAMSGIGVYFISQSGEVPGKNPMEILVAMQDAFVKAIESVVADQDKIRATARKLNDDCLLGWDKAVKILPAPVAFAEQGQGSPNTLQILPELSHAPGGTDVEFPAGPPMAIPVGEPEGRLGDFSAQGFKIRK